MNKKKNYTFKEFKENQQKKRDKFEWGNYVRPTQKLIKMGMAQEDSYGISLGRSKAGEIIVVRFGLRNAERYSPDFWEVLDY